MKLYIDGHEFEARPDQSLFDIIKELLAESIKN